MSKSKTHYIAVLRSDRDTCKELSWRWLSIRPYVLAHGDDKDAVIEAALAAAGHVDIHVEVRS